MRDMSITLSQAPRLQYGRKLAKTPNKNALEFASSGLGGSWRLRLIRETPPVSGAQVKHRRSVEVEGRATHDDVGRRRRRRSGSAIVKLSIRFGEKSPLTGRRSAELLSCCSFVTSLRDWHQHTRGHTPPTTRCRTSDTLLTSPNLTELVNGSRRSPSTEYKRAEGGKIKKKEAECPQHCRRASIERQRTAQAKTTTRQLKSRPERAAEEELKERPDRHSSFIEK
ncbi:uncharacterized protein LOC133554162 [Nerophis ophidion]|uniref:uncharacterized protein LOC133554162 n=1 Tax=Nerophis ophidion TaxID=159077 RepID=UPI002AE067E9|nr:uncharacterized protein LOC133554162 [Nerophis ophidion]